MRSLKDARGRRKTHTHTQSNARARQSESMSALDLLPRSNGGGFEVRLDAAAVCPEVTSIIVEYWWNVHQEHEQNFQHVF